MYRFHKLDGRHLFLCSSFVPVLKRLSLPQQGQSAIKIIPCGPIARRTVALSFCLSPAAHGLMSFIYQHRDVSYFITARHHYASRNRVKQLPDMRQMPIKQL